MDKAICGLNESTVLFHPPEHEKLVNRLNEIKIARSKLNLNIKRIRMGNEVLEMEPAKKYQKVTVDLDLSGRYFKKLSPCCFCADVCVNEKIARYAKDCTRCVFCPTCASFLVSSRKNSQKERGRYNPIRRERLCDDFECPSFLLGHNRISKGDCRNEPLEVKVKKGKT
jgi:hypothetical protein